MKSTNTAPFIYAMVKTAQSDEERKIATVYAHTFATKYDVGDWDIGFAAENKVLSATLMEYADVSNRPARYGYEDTSFSAGDAVSKAFWAGAVSPKGTEQEGRSYRALGDAPVYSGKTEYAAGAYARSLDAGFKVKSASNKSTFARFKETLELTGQSYYVQCDQPLKDPASTTFMDFQAQQVLPLEIDLYSVEKFQ